MTRAGKLLPPCFSVHHAIFPPQDLLASVLRQTRDGNQAGCETSSRGGVDPDTDVGVIDLLDHDLRGRRQTEVEHASGCLAVEKNAGSSTIAREVNAI